MTSLDKGFYESNVMSEISPTAKPLQEQAASPKMYGRDQGCDTNTVPSRKCKCLPPLGVMKKQVVRHTGQVRTACKHVTSHRLVNTSMKQTLGIMQCTE